MLWHKGWLETRIKLLFALFLLGFFLVSAHSAGLKSPAAIKAFFQTEWWIVATLAAMLAGAGIATQPAVQAAKGLHGSLLFTLSLPVSRFRLLAVRAGLGWLELVGGIGILCCGMWVSFPAIREMTAPGEMLQHAAVLVACATGLYSVPVLLATFVDDQWRVWGSGIAFGALWWLFNRAGLPASANIFRAMGEGSPLLAHTIPWTAMAVSLGLAALLFFLALKVVQSREY